MKYFLYLIFALVTCYAPEWGPHYVALFSGGRLNVVGSISDFQESCPSADRGTVQCKVQYRIPGALMRAVSGAKAIGLGFIIHATEVRCHDDNGDKLLGRFGEVESAGKTLDFLNIYQTIPDAITLCANDIIVTAWAPREYRRFGAIGAPVVIGDFAYVDRVRRFVEFFRSPFLIALAAMFFSVFIFNEILSRLLQTNQKPSEIETYSYGWVGFTFAASGLANTLLPVVSDSYLMTRLANWFSFIVMVGPGLTVISGLAGLSDHIARLACMLTKEFHSRIKWRPIQLIALLFVASPFFAKLLAPTYITFTGVFVLLGLLKRNPLLVCLGLAGLSDSLKMMMVPYLPTSYLFMVFSLFCVVDSFVNRVKRSAGLVGLLKWTHDQIECGIESKSVPEILRDFAGQFGIAQVSLIITKPNGGCEIVVQAKNGEHWETSKFFKDRLPPMFAHVLTTRESLWHVQEDSLLAINLRKGEDRGLKYKGEYFSIIPLLKDSVPVGAVAITGYPYVYAKDDFLQLKLTSVINLLYPFLASAIAHSSMAERHGWADDSSKVANAILELKSDAARNQSDDIILASITNIVSNQLDVGVYIGRLDPMTRRIHVVSIAGFPEGVAEMYRTSQFYAVSHNEQGPLALAMTRKKIVTVGDVKWLSSVLHPSTLKIFDAAATQSCAAVPIFDQDESELAKSESVWGVMWLESKRVGAFLPQTEAGLFNISRAIEALLSHSRVLSERNRTKDALAGFVPHKVLEKVLHGESAREEEVGYLLMADIRDSTRISRSVGADKWAEFTKALAGPADRIAGRYGYVLQSVIWDAFYFTKPGTGLEYEYAQVIEFAQELNGLIYAASNEFFGARLFNGSLIRARFCLTFGDITRDIRSSLNNNWTIVGTAMAAISKLEQVCKGVRGWLFVSDSATKEKLVGSWALIDKRVPGTEEQIFTYEKEMLLRQPSAGELDAIKTVSVKISEAA